MRRIVRHEATVNPFPRITERRHCSEQGRLLMSCAPRRGVARVMRPGRTGVAELKRKTVNFVRNCALPKLPAAAVRLIYDVGLEDQENAIDHSLDSCLADDDGLARRKIHLGGYVYLRVGQRPL